MKKKILIEGNKILESNTDGVKRYLVQYLKQLSNNKHWYDDHLEIYIYLNGEIKSLDKIKEYLV